jgi:hypothetical protein
MNKKQKDIMKHYFAVFLNNWQSNEDDFKDEDLTKFWESAKDYVDTNTELYRQDYNKNLSDVKKWNQFMSIRYSQRTKE